MMHFDRGVEDRNGSRLTLRDVDGDGKLTVAMQLDHVAIAMALNRVDVQQVVSFFDDWLFESRPS